MRAGGSITRHATELLACGPELWRSDVVTTTHVKDLAGRCGGIVAVGPAALFVVGGDDGDVLWRTDGTDPGSTVLQHFPNDDGGIIGGDFRVSASDGNNDTELWALPLAALVRE